MAELQRDDRGGGGPRQLLLLQLHGRRPAAAMMMMATRLRVSRQRSSLVAMPQFSAKLDLRSTPVCRSKHSLTSTTRKLPASATGGGVERGERRAD